PPGAQRQRDAGEPTRRVPRRSYHVGRIVPVGAVVEGADGEARRGARAGAAGMLDARSGHVADREPRGAKAPAQVGVLPVKEVALVEAADAIEEVAADQHRG